MLRAAGNLPYNVASPILFKLAALFSAGLDFDDATLMVQREVAARLTARPGTSEYGVLGILMQQVAHIDTMLALPPGAFRPPPRVQSTLLRLRFHPPLPAPRDQAVFTALVRAMFTRRRKTLANALAAGLAMTVEDARRADAEAGVDPGRRAETLAIGEFAALARRLR